MENREIKRVLIANRGEIVLRAMRTIKEMGKEVVVVYSTADRDASYVKMADMAICIGSEKSIDSYLNIPAIISAAEISGADAIFPGYGFLSENQSFAEVCTHHNIKFIGPKPETMVTMSDKSKAKDVMKEAGIPVIPGSEGVLKSVTDAKRVAKEIGYPVIVKASAGGGGRGMRVVEKDADMEKLFLAAESEALNAFGDGSIYMEKYIKNPRHIEVQVVADSHGDVIHVGERDCSLQRRHQKLVEETPAILLDEVTRRNLHQSAVQATKHIKYEGAGTFEFLVDADLNYYFMEMNTRLQVEHTVSEMVSNLDLIQLMVEVAEGKKLPKQSDIELKGHSIECRITAEDPKNFMPSPGRVQKWVLPGGKDVRVDTHVFQDYVVPPHYDSMIGKLIVYAEDREKAINKMKRALNEFQVAGIKTTIDFHKEIMVNPDFLNNDFDTKYLEKRK
jgi:acetyl-CoA carboxylase biotin carboxylase subunit